MGAEWAQNEKPSSRYKPLSSHRNLPRASEDAQICWITHLVNIKALLNEEDGTGREVAEVMKWQPCLKRQIGSTHCISLLLPVLHSFQCWWGLSTLVSHLWLASLLLQEKPSTCSVNIEAGAGLSPVPQTHGGEPMPRSGGPWFPCLQGWQEAICCRRDSITKARRGTVFSWAGEQKEQQGRHQLGTCLKADSLGSSIVVHNLSPAVQGSLPGLR